MSGDAQFTVINMSCLIDVMKFTLVYNGPLSGSGNRPNAGNVRDVRDAMHVQLAYLWQTSVALKRLRWTARVPRAGGEFLSNASSPLDPFEHVEPPAQLPPKHVDLVAPIEKGGKTYIPLVRKSLDTVCHLDILFLRQEDPGGRDPRWRPRQQD